METAQLKALAAQLAQRLAGKKRLLFITGAGLSAEAGLPTYRGVGGLYVDVDTEHGTTCADALH